VRGQIDRKSALDLLQTPAASMPRRPCEFSARILVGSAEQQLLDVDTHAIGVSGILDAPIGSDQAA
jgi:hypothetical protein